MFRRAFILRIAKQLLLLTFLLLGACSPQTGNSTNQLVKTEVKKVVVAKPVVEEDLWRYITNRSTLKAPSQKQLYWHIDWFKKHPDYLTRITKRANPYLYLVVQEVEKAGLPLEIALLPIVESAYYPFSYSHGTASGLWQFIPSTGKLYGLKDSWWYDGRRDVLASTKAAVKYLKNLNKLFKGDWLLAIAAYNSGPGRVQRAIRDNKKQGKPTDFWHLKLPNETKGYVPRLLAVTELIKHPEKYSQTITPVKNSPVLESIQLSTQFDLALISDWSAVELEDLYSLNPGLKRWATPTEGVYTLLLPSKNMKYFKQSMLDNPNRARLRWVRYQVKQGDSLSVIAKKYTTTINQISSVNQLRNNLIKAGDYLIVPVAQKGSKAYSSSESEREKNRLNSNKPGHKVIHSVQKGDSLWLIARKYQVSINNIIKWNHIKRSEPLKLGKKLVLWQSSLSTYKDLSSVTKLGIDIDRKVSYRVKRGDNLSTIAAKFGVSVVQIKQWNGLDNKPLQPGQRLTIMVNVINSKMK
ncbi:MAG: LysM peptidoglycan-binding domain-containing protein [Candidatus Thioglobus sp.]|jgi:membrane-bound lytic murein transglycosylase D|nr:LysM peptidoglycan-binding domain-containing protein [Candidatus Thioglobus sp.]MBT3276622.1 LysM peptidoglycan-binding domain-containing protein [Candidatus Thioglobus sp.]MBT3447659.1 LysM peptidoglycan-binding domain-containing protein [Candidatus Thioglobus sp.]MBT3745261.1 LysM peptidoglycan-binding domain-containing protein [Candidatus Thioglobus sp.]MBT4001364.1 LysM peptidoglycan-binding domain-containing protein [Candidatus Thioglobus sp.]MBT4422259.1 LysM peptidoglycan-binding dom